MEKRTTRPPGRRRSWPSLGALTTLLLLGAGPAQAQITSYSRTVLAGQTFRTMPAPTTITATGGAYLGSSDDGRVVITLPFTFTYDGVGYTQAVMCSNGWVSFGADQGTNSFTAGNLFSASTPNRTVGVHYRDLNANFGTGGGTLQHGVDAAGTGYVFQWNNTAPTSGTSTTNKLNFQLAIDGPASATPGRLTLIYGTLQGTYSTGASIGIENATGGTGNYINALNGLSNSTTTTSAWPGPGNGYQFDPPTPCAGTPTPGNTTGPAVAGSGASFNLGLQNTTAGTGVSYQWFVSTLSAGGPWTPFGTSTATVSTSQTVDSWYYCEVTCSTGPSTGSSTVLAVGTVPVNTVPFSGNNSFACGTNMLLQDHAGSSNYSANANGHTVLDAGVAGIINITGPYATESCCDAVRIYDGAGTGGTLLQTFNGTGTANFTGNAGQTLTVQFTSDGSIQNTGFDFLVTYSGACAPACTQPSASAALVVDCNTLTFTVEVDLTSLGDATNVDITADVNGGGATVVHDDVSALQTYLLGPYASGDVVNVAVVHNQDNVCSLGLGNYGGVLQCAPQGTCALGLSIPDDACPATTDFVVPTTAPGTQLGTNVFLSSVDLILSHTWNSDLEIRLTSPNGVTVPLVLNRFGSGDNLGNPANCPTAVLTLQDGGLALTTTNTSNVTGVYAPEASLTGFEDGSDPNGSWLLKVCDAAGGDLGAVQYVQLNFVTCAPPAATTTVVPDCANGQYYVDVNVSALGTAATIAITSDLNGTEATGVGLGTTQVGPFPSGSTVNLTLVHDIDNTCDVALSAVSFTCPPPNDLCANAIPVACNSITAGTTINASTTGNPGTCTTGLGTAGGVWYTVTGWGGQMTASLCGSGFDTKIGVFTGSCGALTCVAGNDDFCGLQSSVTWTSMAATTYTIYVTGFSTATGNFQLQVACGDENPPCTENTVELELNTDADGGETSYEIIPVGIPTPVCSGSGFPNNAQIFETCCLPDGCYRLRVLDSFGDGIAAPGGYVLRDGNGDRIIDNDGNGNFGSLSAIANNGAFCLPIGTDRLIASQCDKEDFLSGDYFIASANPAVSAEFGVNDANSGYQFWLFDPNGSYTRRVFYSHASPTVGAPDGPLAASYLRPQNLLTLPPPVDLLLNMRIRGRVNGVYNEFGPACRVQILSAPPACPTTQLIDDVNNANFSCGVTRSFGGSDKVYAQPLAGATNYRFRFENIGEGYLRNISGTSAARILNWATLPLQDGVTYDVTVQASFDGGTTYCPFGNMCQVSISNPPSAGTRMAVDSASELAMWPNPNRGDQLYLTISELPDEELTVNVDIHDLYGKRVAARTVMAQGGMLNTVIALDGQLAAGMYLVTIHAGDRILTERLVIE